MYARQPSASASAVAPRSAHVGADPSPVTLPTMRPGTRRRRAVSDALLDPRSRPDQDRVACSCDVPVVCRSPGLLAAERLFLPGGQEGWLVMLRRQASGGARRLALAGLVLVVGGWLVAAGPSSAAAGARTTPSRALVAEI
jgi:hypothetical protein